MMIDDYIAEISKLDANFVHREIEQIKLIMARYAIAVQMDTKVAAEAHQICSRSEKAELEERLQQYRERLKDMPLTDPNFRVLCDARNGIAATLKQIEEEEKVFRIENIFDVVNGGLHRDGSGAVK